MSAWDSKLQEANRSINRIKAFELLLLLLAASLAFLVAATALDLYLRPRFWGRWVISGLWLLPVVFSTILILRTLLRRRSNAAVAALLETKFPQLDNHLINCVLFDRDPQKNPWVEAYIKNAAPELEGIALHELKNRRRRGYGALGVLLGIALLLAPLFFSGGNAWGVALRRASMPFAKITPPMFAKILSVAPGNKNVIQGSGIELSVQASGKSGQEVLVEIAPEDDRKTILSLGHLAKSDEAESFSYRIAKISSPVRYRFFAGDAYPTDEYLITGIPPLCAETVALEITPPAYTKAAPSTLDALKDTAKFPENSTLTVRASFNRALTAADLKIADQKIPMNLTGSTATALISPKSGTTCSIEARDSRGLAASIPFRFEVIPDKAPVISLLSPVGQKAMLRPGAAPMLHFTVSDDYGVKKVRIEKVPRGAKESVRGEALKEWEMQGASGLQDMLWEGGAENTGPDTGVRVIAWDEAASTNLSVGPLVVFETTNLFSSVDSRSLALRAAQRSLGELIGKQQRNLSSTVNLHRKLPEFDIEKWETLHQTEKELQALAVLLLKDTSLGNARLVLNKALSGPFVEAVMRLARICTGTSETRREHAMRSVTAQRQILAMLGVAKTSLEKSDLTQTQTGLIAILEGLLKGQTSNLSATLRAQTATAPSIAPAIIDAQDNLAQDIEAMASYCATQAKNDASGSEFMAALQEIADKTIEWKLHDKMVEIAETLDSEEYASSIPGQIGMTNSIAELRNILLKVREEELQAQQEEAQAVIDDAMARLEKIRDAQAKITESLRNTGSNGDKSEQIDEDMLEEIAELRQQLAEATLKVATDLQNLPDADALNDLVTDVYRTYEEMRETDASKENRLTNIETGLQKEDWVNDLLNYGVDKMKCDEMETWLTPNKDTRARNTEAIDKEEMVADSVGKVLMPEELQDQIGDLLSEEENSAETDDSLTNQGVANPELGWDIAEGEYVDYSAAGKSGNTRPDHKDQDGRSQTGRQGMSDGEFVGATAAIAEGDENIDKRRTKDSKMSGRVEEEGHTDAVATGGGKAAGYSQEKGMTGEINTQRQTSSSVASENSVNPSPLTREYEALYAQAQRNNLPSPGLGKVVALSRLRDMLRRQKASPRQIRELSAKIKQELKSCYSSLEGGFAGGDMGATAALDNGEETLCASPEDVPAEYRKMVSDYFKTLDML